MSDETVRVPRKLLIDICMLIDPVPVEKDGHLYTFRNPMAAETLTKISAIVREMIAAPQPAQGVTNAVSEDKK